MAEYDDSIANHKVNLQQLQRDIEKLKSEAADAVADVITAKEERDLADAVTGISKDGMAKELQNMRELRQKVRAEAHASRRKWPAPTARRKKHNFWNLHEATPPTTNSTHCWAWQKVRRLPRANRSRESPPAQTVFCRNNKIQKTSRKEVFFVSNFL